MVEHSKRKKHHDKDKYYRLAKEQGLRSRAAFKLSQINRKYHLLEKSKVILDLCAAPGGWSQVAARNMAKGGVVIAVDILPIRPIARDVITIIGDVTTEECRVSIRREMQNHKCDLVLSDGAPNVGFDYMRDAYEQNEIALMSLRCATEHLRLNGAFVCKVYRSTDYTALLWVVKQLFKEVDSVKPTSSRSQSSEIFFVCQGYRAPTSIDPRMLDPKSVFEHVEAGTDVTAGVNVNIFHKKYNEQKRFRQGYDFNVLDSTLRNIQSMSSFIDCSDPVKMLSDCTVLTFADEEKIDDEKRISCQKYLEHPATTPEIKTCCSDLKVLGKTDFKGLLLWRLKMIEYKKDLLKASQKHVDIDESAANFNDKGYDDDHSKGSSEEEDEIQAEIQTLKEAKIRKKKREKKKERETMAKTRRRKALGMDLQAIDLPDHDKVFSLATITNEDDLEKVRDADLSKVNDEIFKDSDDEGGINEGSGNENDANADGYDSSDDYDEVTGYNYRLDRELDAAYDRFLKNTKNAEAKSGTKMAKRSKKVLRLKAAEAASEDAEVASLNNDTKAYAKLLNPKDSDDDEGTNERESDLESDDGFHDDPVTPEEHTARISKIKDAAKSQEKSKNPLIHEIEEHDSVVASRWFSNPLFESISSAAQSVSLNTFKQSAHAAEVDYSSDDGENINSDADDESEKASRRSSKCGIDAEDVLAEMPKTDKQRRHERRLKAHEREERRKVKKAKIAGLGEENTQGFEVVQNFDDSDDEKLNEMDEKAKQKELEKRAMIKAGIGKSDNEDINTGFEIVSSTLPRIDDRKYDSENEDYDNDDHAKTLALGTMMLRRSKAKELVDASYNRFAWNDPSDLPEWFVDDENKNYRPQLPIPPELLEKMKERFLTLASKPIAKVAEARARKNKRAATKLAAAKKKAATVANSSDMSEAMKLKAISKAMRGNGGDAPRKKLVVARKGGKTKGGKGMKLVDKRMKNDTRSMKRAEKSKKKGKRRR